MMNDVSQASTENSQPQARKKSDNPWVGIKYGSSAEEEKERREYENGTVKNGH